MPPLRFFLAVRREIWHCGVRNGSTSSAPGLTDRVGGQTCFQNMMFDTAQFDGSRERAASLSESSHPWYTLSPPSSMISCCCCLLLLTGSSSNCRTSRAGKSVSINAAAELVREIAAQPAADVSDSASPSRSFVSLDLGMGTGCCCCCCCCCCFLPVSPRPVTEISMMMPL